MGSAPDRLLIPVRCSFFAWAIVRSVAPAPVAPDALARLPGASSPTTRPSRVSSPLRHFFADEHSEIERRCRAQNQDAVGHAAIW
jgi:hypothetical protein